MQATIQEIDSISDEERRDERYLSIAQQSYMAHKFAEARQFAAKVQDVNAHIQLNNIILFGEAADALAHNRISSAEEAAVKLSPSLESAILWIGVARSRRLEGDRVRSSEALLSALRDARRTDDARRSFLMLAAAEQFSYSDSLMAVQTLSEAVKAFNEREIPAFTTWERAINTKHAMRPFPLAVNGIEFRFSRALPPLVSANSESAIASILSLKNEDLLGQGLIALSAALLNPANSTSQTN